MVGRISEHEVDVRLWACDDKWIVSVDVGDQTMLEVSDASRQRVIALVLAGTCEALRRVCVESAR